MGGYVREWRGPGTALSTGAERTPANQESVYLSPEIWLVPWLPVCIQPLRVLPAWIRRVGIASSYSSL